jgi:hypothetical protein
MGSASDGDSVGDNVGYPSAFQASPFQTGEEVGLAEMNTASVGLSVELKVGLKVGDSVGERVGARVGSIVVAGSKPSSFHPSAFHTGDDVGLGETNSASVGDRVG